ncbi:MAG: PEGA domain-containing protein [Deltaproteobacteria bacterium]|nr:PEGA domain-containing protein [Deltaproteobacteria bacterium]
MNLFVAKSGGRLTVGLSLVASLVIPLAARARPASVANQPATQTAGRVAILPIEFVGPIAEGVRRAVRARLGKGLGTSGLLVVARQDLNAALAPKQHCLSKLCLRRLWVQAGCSYVVGGRVQGTTGDYLLDLWLADAKTGARLATVQRRCDVCGISAVGQQADLAASALLAKLKATRRSPAIVLVDSDPPAARLYVDGRYAGRTPQELRLAPGSHKLIAHHQGFLSSTRSVTSVAGVEERMRIRLLRDVRPQRSLRRWGWLTLSGGIVAAAAGAVLLAVDGRQTHCTGQQAVAGGQCPSALNTSTAGIVSAVGGAVISGVGSFLLYRGYRSAD